MKHLGMKVRVFLRRAACVVSFALLIRRAFLPTAGGSSLTAGIFLLIASPHSWKFSLARTPAHVPGVIEGEGFEGASAWGEIEVPHKTIDLIFQSVIVNNKLTILWGD